MENNGIVASDRESQNSEQRVVTSERRLEMYSGPLPHPDILRRYKEIVPDAPERILKMAEKQNEHRIEIEKKVIGSNILNERLGLMAGFAVCLYALWLGAKILMSGHEGYGFAAIVTALASLVGVYVYAKHKEGKKQKEEE